VDLEIQRCWYSWSGGPSRSHERPLANPTGDCALPGRLPGGCGCGWRSAGYEGWPEQAPFDAIIVTCSLERVQQPLLDQLRNGGRHSGQTYWVPSSYVNSDPHWGHLGNPLT